MGKSRVVQNVAIYTRVSTHDQDCARQVADLTTWAKRADYTIIETYKETASGAKNDRAIRAEIIKLARARKIDAVIVTELSRWGRSLQDLISTLKELHSYGVSLLTQSGMQFDLNTAQGKLMAHLMGALAEFERDIIAERTRSGIAQARQRGKKIGRQPGQVIRPHPMTKSVVQMIEAGVSYRTIADKLKISKTTVQTIANKHCAA